MSNSRIDAGQPQCECHIPGCLCRLHDVVRPKPAGIDGERERLRHEMIGVIRDLPSDSLPSEITSAVMAEVVDPLLAKIRRVEELADECNGNTYWGERSVGHRIRRALGGGS